MNLLEFGKYFKMHRIKSGYKSQRKLASVSGISNGTIARIEAGTQKVSINTIRVLSKYLTSTTYSDLLEKLGYFDGLSNEKREQLKESYDDRVRFTEEFRKLIHILAPEGEFPEEIKNNIKKDLKDSFDDNFNYSPEELIDIMYEKGDASDMLDFYSIFHEIAEKHSLIPPDPKKNELMKEMQTYYELTKELSDLFIKRGIISRYEQEQYIDLHIGEINTENIKKLIQLLKLEIAELELLDIDQDSKGKDTCEILTFFQKEDATYRYRGRILSSSDIQRILIMLSVLFPNND